MEIVMNRFSKVISSVVLGVSLAAPFAAVPEAAANPVASTHQRIYWVYYRGSAHSSWTCYGGYYQSHQAQQAVNWFQQSGYSAFYRAAN
jgi:ABC-type arginine/histidine transport system permease subunit